MNFKQRLKAIKVLIKGFIQIVFFGKDGWTINNKEMHFGDLKTGNIGITLNCKVRMLGDSEEKQWLVCFDGETALGFVNGKCTSGKGNPLEFKGPTYLVKDGVSLS